MKKVILASVLAVVAASSVGTANAASGAQIFCSGTAGGAATATTVAGSFVKVPFTPKCSVNVHLAGSDSDTFFRVGSGSLKGKTSFAGSSNGGGVVAAGACATTGCTAANATTAMTSTYAASS